MKKVLFRITLFLVILSLANCADKAEAKNESIAEVVPVKKYKKVHGISEEIYHIDSSAVKNVY